MSSKPPPDHVADMYAQVTARQLLLDNAIASLLAAQAEVIRATTMVAEKRHLLAVVRDKQLAALRASYEAKEKA